MFGRFLEVTDELGDRPVAIVRELTKLHEEIIRGRVSEVLQQIRDRDLKGEIVLVVGGSEGPSAPPMETLVAEAAALVAGGRRKRDAATEVARRYRVAANEIYRVLTLPP